MSSPKERRGSVFLWRRILRTLEAEIGAGGMKPGDKLPTEIELAQRFKVHRNTISRVISNLQNKGLIRGERGRGIFVRESMVQHSLGPKTRLSTTLRKLDREGSRQIVGRRTIRASADVASALEIEAGKYVRCVELLSLIGNQPVSIASHYFPLPRFHEIDNHIEEHKSISTALKYFGVHDYRRRETRIRAIALSKREANLLQHTRNSPAFLLVNLNTDQYGVPIQAAFGKVSSLWVELIINYEE